MLLVGLQCRDAADSREVRALATRLGAPVLTTYKAKGVLPDDHPLHAGIVTGAVVERSILEKADRIVAVGLDPVELIPKPWAYESPVMHINRESSSPRYYRPDLTLTGAPAAILRELTHRIVPDVSTAWGAEEPARLKRVADQLLAIETDGLAPHRVAQLCRERSPRNAVAVVDSGAHMFPMTQFWTASEPRSFLISNGLATMGFALPAAIAAQLVHPDRRVLCFTGDGGLMMVAAEMETVKCLGLPIVVVVFNDHALSLIQIKQEQKGYGEADMSYAGSGLRRARPQLRMDGLRRCHRDRAQGGLGRGLDERGTCTGRRPDRSLRLSPDAGDDPRSTPAENQGMTRDNER